MSVLGSWAAGDILAEEIGVDEAEAQLQDRLSQLDPAEAEARGRTKDALSRVRQLQAQEPEQ